MQDDCKNPSSSDNGAKRKPSKVLFFLISKTNVFTWTETTTSGLQAVIAEKYA